MKRPHYLLAGLAAYLLAVGSMATFAAFLAGFSLPWALDRAEGGSWARALAVDLGLLASFALVHSGLARPGIRRKLLGRSPAALERALYSTIAGLQILLLMAAWKPLASVVWQLDAAWARGAAWTAFGLGWTVVLVALPTVGSARLFGLRQAWEGAWDRTDAAPALVPRGIYRYLRHPLYSGTILALFATPRMSAGHLLLACAMTLYILIGVRLEERDLALRPDAGYLAYRRDVPAFLPGLRRRPRVDPGA